MAVGVSLYLIFILVMASVHVTRGTHYQTKLVLYQDKLGRKVYDPQVRPVRSNVSEITEVSVTFSLVSIVDVSDVSQSFSCNGFVTFKWQDQMLTWNPKKYDDIVYVYPDVEQLWLPRTILLNTLQDRDPFKDAHAPLSVSHKGFVTWSPGGLFSTTCKLDLTKFPFDDQVCSLTFISMSYDVTEVVFLSAKDEVTVTSDTENGEWELTGTSIDTGTYIAEQDDISVSSVKFTFALKRRPASFMISTLMPVVIQSLLNIMVFLVPVESGEKVTYGITVMLSQAVFVTILSGMLPRTSQYLPCVTIYVFCLLVMAAFTVVISIIVVHLYELGKGHNGSAMSGTPRSSTTEISTIQGEPASGKTPVTYKRGSSCSNVKVIPPPRDWGAIGRLVNDVSMAVSCVALVAINVGFTMRIWL